jgi:hypothetical protein
MRRRKLARPVESRDLWRDSDEDTAGEEGMFKTRVQCSCNNRDGMAWHGMAWCAMDGKCNWRLELQTTLGGGVLALVLALPFRIGVGSVGFSRSVRCDAMRWLLVMKLNVF